MTSGTPEQDASRKVLVQGFLYTAAAVAPVLVTVLVTPAVTRTLGSEEYGVIGLATTFIQIGLVVLSFGIAEPITRHGLLEDSGVQGARALVIKGALPSLLFAAAVAASSSWWVPSLLHVPWRPAWLLCLVAAFLFGVITNIQAVLRSMDRPTWFVAIGFTASLGGPVLGLVAVLLVNRSAESYLAGLAVGYAMSLVLGLPAVFNADGRKGRPGDFRRALRMGLPMIFNQIASYLMAALLVTLTTRFAGLASGGRVQLALFVGTSPTIVAVAISNSWAPTIYRTTPEDRPRVAAAVARDVANVIAALGAGVALLAPWIFMLLVPASYEPFVLARIAAEATAGGVLTVIYLACVHVIMVTGRNGGLAVVVVLSVALASLAVQLLGLDRDLERIGWGFPIAYLAMAVSAVLLRNLVGAARWAIQPVLPSLALSILLAAAGSILPTTAAGLAIRGAGALVVAALGLRVVGRVLHR